LLGRFDQLRRVFNAKAPHSLGELVAVARREHEGARSMEKRGQTSGFRFCAYM
jgi:hypothetical protein